MDLIREFFRDKTRAQLLMIAALVLLLVSQFFYYLDDPGTGYLSIDADFNTIGYYTFGAQGTGWQLHPHAYVILVALGFAFLRDDIIDLPWFRKFGWWLAVVLVFAATIPGAYFRADGGAMGGIAVLMALGAAILNWAKSKRPAEPREEKQAGPKSE
jgi:hypothetical protein